MVFVVWNDVGPTEALALSMDSLRCGMVVESPSLDGGFPLRRLLVRVGPVVGCDSIVEVACALLGKRFGRRFVSYAQVQVELE